MNEKELAYSRKKKNKSIPIHSRLEACEGMEIKTRNKRSWF